MELLEKTRKINKLLQRGEKVEYNAIARLLRDVIGANIYIVGRKGGVKGSALQDDFECDIMREQVLDVKTSRKNIWILLWTRKKQFQILNIKIRNVPLLKVQNAFLIRKKLLSCLFTVTANVLVL